MKSKLNITPLFFGLSCLLTINNIHADQIATTDSGTIGRKVMTYNNLFISYASPEYVATIAEMVKTKKLAGAFLWPISGDLSPDNKGSLLNAMIVNGLTENYQTAAYWENWSVYQNDPAKAIQHANYPITGSYTQDGKTIAQNPSFDKQIAKLTILNYAFLEAQTNSKNDGHIGRLYFDDPTADLVPNDAVCASSDILKSVCTFINVPSKMGNFEAFAKLNSIKRIFSVGGYAHDDAFEDTFASPEYMNNFVDSAAAIINGFAIDGIDLDYESVTMTSANAHSYAQLIHQLREKLPNTFISITLLVGPKDLKVFSSADLQSIYQDASRINLMTYDFHGAFDMLPGQGGYTGLLANVYPDAYPNKDFAFSIQDSLDTFTALLQPSDPSSALLNKVMLGVPAYGRALYNVDITDNNGLYQKIDGALIPQGNDDLATCSSTLGSNACSGTFDYNYIVNDILENNLDNQHNISALTSSDVNGTIASLNSWTHISRTNQVLGAYLDATETNVSGQNWYVNFKHAYPGSVGSPLHASANVLLIAFATLNPNGTLNDPAGNWNWDYVNPQTAAYSAYMPTVDQFKNIGGNVLISVGGWQDIAPYSQMQWATINPHTVADSIINMVTAHNLDGVDIDPEYVGFAGVAQGNKNISALILELRQRLPNKIITWTVFANGDNYCPNGDCSTSPFSNPAVLDALDYIFVMNYQLGSSDYQKYMATWTAHVPASELVYGIRPNDDTMGPYNATQACQTTTMLQNNGYAGSFLWAISAEQEQSSASGATANSFLGKMNAGLQGWACS